MSSMESNSAFHRVGLESMTNPWDYKEPRDYVSASFKAQLGTTLWGYWYSEVPSTFQVE